MHDFSGKRQKFHAFHNVYRSYYKKGNCGKL